MFACFPFAPQMLHDLEDLRVATVPLQGEKDKKKQNKDKKQIRMKEIGIKITPARAQTVSGVGLVRRT